MALQQTQPSVPPRDIGQLLEQAAALHRAGDFTGAERLYRAILKKRPQDPDALHLLGLVASQTGNAANAVDLIKRALAVRDDFPDAHLNLGIILAKRGERTAAEHHFRRALFHRPALVGALANLAVLLRETGRLDESTATLRTALRCDPQQIETYVALARNFRIAGDIAELLAVTEAGLRLDGQHPILWVMRGEALFARSRLKEGWACYRWRFRSTENPVAAKDYALPLWQGEDIAARRILVWNEQSPGDEVMYANMLPDMIARSKSCVVQCSPRLKALFTRSFPQADVIGGEIEPATLSGIDLQSPAAGPGEYLRPDVASFPARTGYLVADPERRAALRASYQDGDARRLLVGIAWRSSGVENAGDKSVGIAEWGAILSVPGVTFVNLQYGDCAQELNAVRAAFRCTIVDDTSVDPFGDLDGYAAQVAAMDLVISASNTAAHFAGALGIPAFCMLPVSLGRGRRWYWFAEQGRCPWYPTMRVFLQREANVWLDVIRDAGLALVDLAVARGTLTDPAAYLRGLANAFAAIGRQSDAEAVYARLADLPGVAAEAHYHIARLRKAAGDVEGALAALDRAIAADARYWPAHNDKGVALAKLNRFEDAIATYRAGLRSNPANAEMLSNLAAALRNLGRSGEALDRYREALALQPENQAIQLGFASALHESGDTQQALSLFERILATAPDCVDAHYARAVILLASERLAEGWREAEWRLKRPAANVRYDHFPQQRWNGESLAGKNVLIWTEQGIGDEILTASMLGDAIDAAKHVTFLCSQRLVPWMRTCFPRATVEERKDPLPAAAKRRYIDFQMSVADLGLAFRTSRASFPLRPGYLSADRARTQVLRAKYQAARPGTRLVGLSWDSPGNYEIGWLKGTNLLGWQPILATPGVTFVSLQYGNRKTQLEQVRAQLGVDILSDDGVDPLGDIGDFAAQVAAMDLVVSVSNTTVHLAGALGIPTWVLLADGRGRLWYWFRDRPDSPWYSSLRLIRQAASGDWAGVIARCAADLKSWVSTQ